MIPREARAGSGDAAQGPALTPHANDPVASSAAYGAGRPGEQIDPGQQAERAMAFVLMIPREARAGSGDAAQGPALTPHANDPVASSAAYGAGRPSTAPSRVTSGPLIATVHINNPPKRSRLPGYDAEIAMTICLRLLNRESLRSICADPRMPAKATVCRWLARNQEFCRWYALARAFQFQTSPTKCSRSPITAATYVTRATGSAPSSWL